MGRAFFLAGLRTPFGRASKGAYRDVRPDDLLVELVGASRARFPEVWATPPDDFVVGCAYPEGEQGYNIARTVALGSGLEVPGMTVNRLCASSLEAVSIAAARVRAGFGSRYLAGGVESMSRIPRRGANFSESDRILGICPTAYTPNGETAEKVARQFPLLTRAAQEELAARSHELADAAWRAGHYAGQVHPWLVAQDEFVRVPVDRVKMASLPPAFAEDGVVTAATSSPLTDGATCGWVVDEAGWKRSGERFALEILDVAVGHVAPEVMGLGPVPATRILLGRNGLSADAVAAWEINEAFAVQVLASIHELQIPPARVNTWGGAMALGHPLGASGLRLVITLLHRLAVEAAPGALGIATLCVGGGQGVSLLARLAAAPS